MRQLSNCILLISLFLSCKQGKTVFFRDNINQDSLEYLNKSIAFLNDIMPKQLQDSNFILEDKPFGFEEIPCLKEALEDTALLSKEEAQIIQSKRFYPIRKWEKKHFPKIKIVSTDTIKSIFNDKNKGWDYIHKNIGRALHNFSYPIFFRDFTYCFFYDCYGCGMLCVEGSLKLYRFENGKWIAVKSYYSLVS